MSPGRPWPVPRGPWVMAQRWSDLLFAHWPVPASALRPRVPARLEIETFDGTAWVAAVPFRMEAVRPRGLPAVPGLSAFPELNLRTYVTLGGRPGVFFFSLDASSRLAVVLGRRLFSLPYLHARIACRPVADDGGDDGRAIDFRSERTHPDVPPVRFAARYRPTGEVFRAAPGTLDHFLTERYCFYTSEGSVRLDAREGDGPPGGAIHRAEVDHVSWPLQPAAAILEAGPLLASVGLADALRHEPRVLVSHRLDVRAWPLRRV